MRTRALITTIAIAVASCGTAGTSPGTSTSTTASIEATSTVVTVTTIGSSTTTAAPTTTSAPDEVQIEISEGAVSGPDEIEVDLGDTVDVWVLSDVDDEVHVHGYELVFEVEGGVPFDLSFVADVPGVFEVEVHTGHTRIFDLRVIG